MSGVLDRPGADPEGTSWCQGSWIGQGQILKKPVVADNLGLLGQTEVLKNGLCQYLDPGSVWISLQNHDIFKNGKRSRF